MTVPLTREIWMSRMPRVLAYCARTANRRSLCKYSACEWPAVTRVAAVVWLTRTGRPPDLLAKPDDSRVCVAALVPDELDRKPLELERRLEEPEIRARRRARHTARQREDVVGACNDGRGDQKMRHLDRDATAQSAGGEREIDDTWSVAR